MQMQKLLVRVAIPCVTGGESSFPRASHIAGKLHNDIFEVRFFNLRGIYYKEYGNWGIIR